MINGKTNPAIDISKLFLEPMIKPSSKPTHNPIDITKNNPNKKKVVDTLVWK